LIATAVATATFTLAKVRLFVEALRAGVRPEDR